MKLRFHLPPGGDVPPHVAARRLGLELDAFKANLPQLEARGFPSPDPTTGNYSLEEIDEWRADRKKGPRSPQLVGQPGSTTALDARSVVADRVRRLGGG